MKVSTRLFGEVEVADDKIVTLDQGIVGFPDLKKFTLIYDAEREGGSNIMWLQSLDEPQFALPVVQPETIVADYNPHVEDNLLEPLGELTEDNLYVLVTIKVPANLEEMTVNLKAPIIVNTDTKKAGQVIVEDDVDVRYPVYEILQKAKEEAEGK